MDIFTPSEAEVLIAYRKANFADKTLNPVLRRKIGKCPLTPLEVNPENPKTLKPENPIYDPKRIESFEPKSGTRNLYPEP